MKITEIADNIRKVETKPKEVTFKMFIVADFVSNHVYYGNSGVSDIVISIGSDDGSQFKLGENGTTNHITKVNGYSFDRHSKNASNYAKAFANAYPNDYTSTEYLEIESGCSTQYTQRNWTEITLPVGFHQVIFQFYQNGTQQSKSNSFSVSEKREGTKLAVSFSWYSTSIGTTWI